MTKFSPWWKVVQYLFFGGIHKYKPSGFSLGSKKFSGKPSNFFLFACKSLGVYICNILSVFANKISNPFMATGDGKTYIHPPCRDSCSFCMLEYNEIFPKLIRDGICHVLMDLFAGENRISGDIIIDPVLIDAIKKYPIFQSIDIWYIY